MSDQKGLCALCGIQGTLMCPRCYECYCSVKCQMEDWAKHKLICIRMAMASNLGTIDKSDMPRLVAVDNNNKERKSIDFPLKLWNKNAVAVEENVQDVGSQPFFHINDVELIPIFTGKSVKMFVLDDSMVEYGLITVADINPEVLEKFQTVYAEIIMKYCLDPSIPQGYSPRENELCFSIYEVDNKWYRAGCLRKYSDDEFLMFFVDYGYTTIKGKKDLRKITEDFLYRSPANTCKIDGLPHVMSTELLKRIKSIVQADVELRADYVEKCGRGYIITIKKIKKLLP